MNGSRALSLLLSVLLCLSLCACGGRGAQAEGSGSPEPESSAEASTPGEEETETLPREAEVLPFGLGYYQGLGLNPYRCDNAQNQSLMGLLYEPLYELDEHFAAQPVLAKSVSAKPRVERRVVETKKDKKAEDQTQTATETPEKTKTRRVDVTDVTVKIREGAKFSDGSTVRADDVEHSLRCAAAKGSVYRSRLGSLTQLRTVGRDTVKFTIDGGSQCVAELLDIPIVKNGEGEKDFPIGSGPYTVQRSKKGRVKALVASEKWWRLGEEYQIALSQGLKADGSGEGVLTKNIELPLKRIRLYNAGDSDELIFGFSSAAVTAVASDLTAPDALSYTGSFDVTDYPTTDLFYLGCNTRQGPCQDQKLRSAIYRSVNREKLVERMMAGHATAAELPVNRASELWDEELAEKLSYDREKAKKLCKETGVTSELKLIVNRESVFKAGAAREAARHLRAAGLSVKVETLSWKEYKAALKEGDYDLYFGEVVLNAGFDLSPLLSRNGALNFSGYDSDTLSAAERNFRSAGRDSRAKAASALCEVLAQEASVVPICFKNGSLLTRSGSVLRSRATQSNVFHWLWDWVLDKEVAQASN